ncbi:MAG TPA: heme ABC exporter ATP-binding protein CcmA [Rhizomicrobium sp.]|nr:heme ABC exporter ATP-binding protein CcmA [Rhizomicrobium sp.]
MSRDCLTATNLTCIRGQRVLFRALSFRVGAGQVLSLEGPNGAGKTSLLRMIAGFIAPAAGTIAIGSIADAEERGRLVGWLGHNDAAKSQLSPGEALGFFAGLYGSGADIAAALAEVGLGPLADLPCQYLSAGQKKRLALARLKLSGRPLWLLDEPLAALDAAGKQLAAGMITAHAQEGGIILAATHEPLGLACERLVLGASA